LPEAGSNDPPAFDAEGDRCRSRLGGYHHGGAFGRAAACDVSTAARPKDVYAGTTSLFFTVGNATKAVPWLLLVKPAGNEWILMAGCLLAIPTGVWLGWRLHGRLNQRQLYRACYGLLVVTALKLLWDGLSGYLA
jgi:uncharacterized membrane protein YfcA